MPSVPEEGPHGLTFVSPERDLRISSRSGAKGRGPWDGPGEGPLPVTRIAIHSEVSNELPEVRKTQGAEASRRDTILPPLRSAPDLHLLAEAA